MCRNWPRIDGVTDGHFLIFSLLACLVTAHQAAAQDTPDYFRQNCLSCHTIGGGRLTGPDLQNVADRKDRPWLVEFIVDPKGMLDRGDPYAQKILQESRGVPMPTAPGMTRERAEKLLDLIEAESKLEESQFKGLSISTEPFTAQDAARGRDIFLGTVRLTTGGTACIACHSMYDMPALGGGRLGPDLTNVYDRLKGRNSLGAWLVAPGTETMQPIFKKHPLEREEIHALVAYFDQSSPHRPADPTPGRIVFLLLGLGGAVGMMFACDTIWKWRFRGVRSPLVNSAKAKGI